MAMFALLPKITYFVHVGFVISLKYSTNFEQYFKNNL